MGRKNAVDVEPLSTPVQDFNDDDLDESGNNGKYGKPRKYDPTFRGPIKNRHCTDIICCLFFIICIGGLVYVGILAWTTGDPTSILYPTDSMGQVCGRDDPVKDKPYLFFFDFIACANLQSVLAFSCGTPQVCVSSCPNETYAPYAAIILGSLSPGLIEWDKFYCTYDFDPETEYLTGDYQGFNGLALMFERGKCASYYLPETPYARICVPTILVEAVSSLDTIFSNTTQFIATADGFTQGNATALATALSSALQVYLELSSIVEVIYEDVIASWHVIMIGLGIGMFVSLFYILLMRWLAGIVVYFTILALYTLLAFGTAYCFYYWSRLANVEGSDAALEFSSNLLSYLRLRTTWLVFGIVLGVLLLALMLITCCLCTQIRIAVSLIREASRAIGHMMSTLFFPIIPFILQMIFLAIWVAIAAFLATSHRALYTVVDAPIDFSIENGTECEQDNFTATYPNSTAKCQFATYSLPAYTTWLQFFNVFMFFWLVNFAIAIGQMGLAGAFASYYFAFTKPRDIPAFPLTKSIWRSIRYHLGSLAFGSLIIAIIQLIRVILEYVEQKLRSKADHPVIKYIFCCVKCLFWCLEKFMKFINKNAYILVAIYGDSFCKSAKSAFFLLMRNILRVAVVNKLTDFVIFLGKLSVTALTGIFAFFYFTNQITFLESYVAVPDVSYYWTPIIIIAVGTYLIAKCFFSVYDMAVDTLFLCFLEDIERHDGSAEKPYYMSASLKKIVGKKNKF